MILSLRCRRSCFNRVTYQNYKKPNLNNQNKKKKNRNNKAWKPIEIMNMIKKIYQPKLIKRKNQNVKDLFPIL